MWTASWILSNILFYTIERTTEYQSTESTTTDMTTTTTNVIVAMTTLPSNSTNNTGSSQGNYDNSQRLLNYLAFKYFDWWRLFQKRVVRTKLDIYVFYLIMHVLRHFQQYLCYILVAMFIVSRNWGISLIGWDVPRKEETRFVFQI